MQHHERFAGFLAADFDVPPAQLRANAGAERLGDGLFGRKAHGQKRRRLAMRKAVGDLVRQQNPADEAFAKFFMRRRDARHFDDVNAGAQNHVGFTIPDLLGCAQGNLRLATIIEDHLLCDCVRMALRP